MFIRYFRKSYLQQYLLLLIFAIALWMPSFLNPPFIAAKSQSTPLYNLIIQLTNSKLIWVISAFSLLFLQSIFFNLILTKNEFIRKTSVIGSFIYFTLMSHHIDYQYFNPALLSHFFILLCIHFLLNMYGKEVVLRDTFRLGFYIGLATLFYLPSIFYIALIYITLLVYRASYWREWVIPIFSFFTPYIFLFTYYFACDKLYVFNSYFQYFFNDISISWPYNDTLSIVISIALGLIFLISFLHILRTNNEKGVQVRKKTTIFINLLLISIICLLVSTEPMTSFSTFIIPIALIVAVYFNDLRKTLWIDIYFTAILILLFINNY